MAYIISIEDLKKLINNNGKSGNTTTKTKTTDFIITGTSGEKTIDTGKKTGIASLYFNDIHDISNFQYTPDGKNLIITTGAEGLTVTVKNYFSKADSSATKSIIKYIKYKDTEGKLQTKNIINEGYIYSPSSLPFNPVKGVITGTVFSDVITAHLDEPYGKNNKGLTINAGKGNDNITGTQFNDTITGGTGINTINFDFSEDGFGKDTIKLTKGENVILHLTENESPVSVNELSYTKSGNNLVLIKDGNTDNTITIKDYFKNQANVYIYAEENNAAIKDYLKNEDSVLNIKGSGTFSGTGYGDNITGSSKADVISAGAGNDTINAGAKNDTIKLGTGNKTVRISNTDGNDKITLSNTTNLNIIYDETVDRSKLIFAKSYNKKDLYIFRENNQYTIVKNYFKGNTVTTNLKVNGNDIVAGATVYNLSQNNKLTIYSDSYAVLGNLNDNVAIKAGNNTVNLLKGNDTVAFSKTYDGTTTIKTSGGNDNITVKEGVKNDISVEKDGDNFDIKVKTVNENESISYHTVAKIEKYKDITSKVNIKDSNNNIAATLKSGSGTISGTGNNDIIVASTGKDTITGGKVDDIIYTRGGNDTIVLSGNYGQDTVYSDGSNKVVLSMDSINIRDNFSYNLEDLSDLTYVKNKSNSVTYKNFFTEDTADLWMRYKKQYYHVINDKETTTDYTEDKKNNIVFLAKDGQNYTGAEYDKSVNVVNSLNNTTLNYSGSNDYYMSKGDYTNNYNLTLDSNTKLYVLDEGGNDTLSLENSSESVSLLFNVSTKQEVADTGILVCNQDNLTYNSLMTGVPNGRIEIENYFKAGEIENMSTSDYVMDLKGWTNYVSGKVKEWLTEHKKESLKAMLLSAQTKANKNAIAELLNVYKEATYDKYVASITNEDLLTLANENFADLTFVKSGNDLTVYKTADNTETLIKTVNAYFDTENVNTLFYAKNADGQMQEYNIGSGETPVHIRSAETAQIDATTNTLSFDSDYTGSTLTLTDGVNPELIFEDKQFLDFYTKKSSVIYTEGDPLIYKGGLNQGATEGDWKNGGNGLTIGDVYVENADGKTGEVHLDTTDGTKTIILGQGTINGTFESEIISGSNSADTINAYGGDDLIYSGAGDDVLNFVKSAGGEATGNNTARMVVIGGSDYLPEEHPTDAISVYDSAGNDTYNTSLDVGLYIEDNGGTNDTINIDATKTNSTTSSLRYMFDIVNPKKLETNPNLTNKLYTDLFIYDKADNSTMLSSLTEDPSLEGMQGKFGYLWIDDYYSSSQKIENVKLIDGETQTNLNLNYTDSTSDLYNTYQAIAGWLAGTNTGFGGIFAVEGDYDTAWDVVKGSSTKDKSVLMLLYQNKGSFM